MAKIIAVNAGSSSLKFQLLKWMMKQSLLLVLLKESV